MSDLFHQALEHHRGGNLREAEVLYRQILAMQPNHLDALHMLGVLASQIGRNDIAAKLLDQALALAPESVPLLCELAEIERRLGHGENAEKLCRRAIALDGKAADAHYNLGVILHQQQRLEEAASSYRRAIELNGDLHLAHHNLGNVLREQGQLEEAITEYHLALAIKPDFAPALGNLGLAFYFAGNLASAITAFSGVLKLTPDDPVAYNCLGSALRDQGHTDAAMAAYSQAIALRPDYSAHNNLGKLLHDTGRLTEALPHYRRAIELDSSRAEAYQNLGMALEKLGQKSDAAAMYREALKRGVTSPAAKYHMAAVTGTDAPAAAPAEHVVKLFDEFAATFDERLVQDLHYQTPQRLRKAFEFARPGAPKLDVLDLGCGTGLCGPLFREAASKLVGVDLSPGMIEKAKAKGVYDELVVGDIVAEMVGLAGGFDVLLAADVLVYFGDLSPVMAAARTCLRDRGVFIFSVERADDIGYTLRPTRRYVHSKGYLRQMAGEHGFGVLSLTQGVLREEAGQPVEGLIAVFER